jgi:hypothetical protein
MWVKTNENIDAGNYTLVITASTLEFTQARTNQFVNLIISPLPPPLTKSAAPYFITDFPTDEAFEYGDAWGYTLPEAEDLEGDEITITIVYKPVFVTFNEKTRSFSVKPGATT